MSTIELPDYTDLKEITACPVCKERSMEVESIKRDLFSDGGVIERICTVCRFWCSEVVSKL